jgi:hypothetical protein
MRAIDGSLHILILFNRFCTWLGHLGGRGHRSSSVRIRLQSQDDDYLRMTPVMTADRRSQDLDVSSGMLLAEFVEREKR